MDDKKNSNEHNEHQENVEGDAEKIQVGYGSFKPDLTEDEKREELIKNTGIAPGEAQSTEMKPGEDADAASG